jgi:hypothetical protein
MSQKRLFASNAKNNAPSGPSPSKALKYNSKPIINQPFTIFLLF